MPALKISILRKITKLPLRTLKQLGAIALKSFEVAKALFPNTQRASTFVDALVKEVPVPGLLVCELF